MITEDYIVEYLAAFCLRVPNIPTGPKKKNPPNTTRIIIIATLINSLKSFIIKSSLFGR